MRWLVSSTAIFTSQICCVKYLGHVGTVSERAIQFFEGKFESKFILMLYAQNKIYMLAQCYAFVH